MLDNLGPDGFLITKDGKAIARVLPVSANCAELIGSMEGRVQIKGDILSTGVWKSSPVTRDKKIRTSKLVPMVR